MANEKRLIWDEDAKRHLIALAVGHHTETLHIDMILNAILHNTPTADAVEVVRCKQCSYWDKAKPNQKGFLICPASGMEIMAHDYCSYGERKNDA